MKIILRKLWEHRSLFLRIVISAYYKCNFLHFGWLSYINNPLRIDGSKSIYIGNRCTIEYKTWIAAMPLTGYSPRLVIEDGCIIGHFNHIYATRSVILRRNVLTADKVYISDNIHGYENIDEPILRQSIIQHGEVEIGEGSWLGENVCVLGAKIGKHCVIGANSVVTRDIPDYSIAVGVPAKVIKQYDFNTSSWKKAYIEGGSDISSGGGKICSVLFAA